MTELNAGNELLCPFAEILERRVLGDSSEEEDAKLIEHVEQGCPTCAPRFQEDRHLTGLIEGALEPVALEVEARRAIVLSKISDAIARDEEARRTRRLRRMSVNTVLLVTIVSAVVVLSVEYLMMVAVWKRVARAQRVAAEAEENAIVVAMERYRRERGELPSEKGWLASLSGPRRDKAGPYYSPDPRRVKNGEFLDPWGRPYVYQRTNDGARVISVGPNGRDEGGAGDDVVMHLVVGGN